MLSGRGRGNIAILFASALIYSSTCYLGTLLCTFLVLFFVIWPLIFLRLSRLSLEWLASADLATMERWRASDEGLPPRAGKVGRGQPAHGGGGGQDRGGGGRCGGVEGGRKAGEQPHLSVGKEWERFVALRLAFFKSAKRSFGNTALLLSGGATLGLYHIGVLKAMGARNLFPRVISGTSAGAVLAAFMAVRTDEEIMATFADEEMQDWYRGWRTLAFVPERKN